MSRVFNLVLLVVMVVAAVATYDMKHKAELAADKVARLENRIAHERDSIRLLRAELSTLQQPNRLQAIVDHYPDYFRLEPFSPSQIATIDEIPMRPIGQASEEAIAEIIRQNLSVIQ